MLDLLSDIGGLVSIIMGGLSMILGIWNYKSFEYHFLTNFFKMKATKGNQNDDYNYKNYAPKKICNIKEYFLELIPVIMCVKCCRRNKRHAAIEKARQALNKEVNIINIIRILRYLKLAMRQVLPKHVRIEAKKRSRYVVLDDQFKNFNCENQRDRDQDQIDIRKSSY